MERSLLCVHPAQSVEECMALMNAKRVRHLPVVKDGAWLGVSRLHLTSLFRLSYLSPQIIRAILNWLQTTDLRATRLVSLAKNLPHDWQEQWRHLGFASA